MHVVAAAEHLQGVAVEIAVVVFVFERPGRDLRPRRLPLHVIEVFVADRAIDRAENDDLVFAHEFLREASCCRDQRTCRWIIADGAAIPQSAAEIYWCCREARARGDRAEGSRGGM